MNEIQKILAKAKASKAGQAYCPQRIFEQLTDKSDNDMITLVKENKIWVWWLIDKAIATPQELAKLGAINKADDNTGEITEGLWYVPKGITVERLSSGKVVKNYGTIEVQSDGWVVENYGTIEVQSDGWVVKNYGNIEKQSGGWVKQNDGTIREQSGGWVKQNGGTIREQSGGLVEHNGGTIGEQSGGLVEHNCGIISNQQEGSEK